MNERGPSVGNAQPPLAAAFVHGPRLWTAERVAIGFIAALTLVRIGVLLNAVIGLGPEEAQYWAWSRHVAFGYFAKPPMIAWLIAGATALCGDGEPCVRMAAPLLQGATAFVIFLIARRLYDDRTAVWSAIGYATLPAVWLSSGLISSDVPLVFCWALALYFYSRALSAGAAAQNGAAFKWAALTGLSIGLGLLSNYVMLYFPLCALLHCAVSRDARRALLSPAGALAALVLMIVIAPHIAWIVGREVATVTARAAALWPAPAFNPAKLGEFIGGQIGVFGPVFLATYVIGSATLRRRVAAGPPGADLFLFVFSAPILLLVCGGAVVARANADWTAPAYIAAIILVSAWLVRARDKMWLRVGPLPLKIGMWLRVSLGISLICGIALYTWIAVPQAIEILGPDNTFKRYLGWDTLAAETVRRAQDAPTKAILTDHPAIAAELLYNARKSGLPIMVFERAEVPSDGLELNARYGRTVGGPVLYVSFYTDKTPVLSHFQTVEELGTYRLPRGNALDIPCTFYRLDGYKD